MPSFWISLLLKLSHNVAYSFSVVFAAVLTLVPAFHLAILVFPICHGISLFQSLNLHYSPCLVDMKSTSQRFCKTPQGLQFVPSEPEIRPEYSLLFVLFRGSDENEHLLCFRCGSLIRLLTIPFSANPHLLGDINYTVVQFVFLISFVMK